MLLGHLSLIAIAVVAGFMYCEKIDEGASIDCAFSGAGCRQPCAVASSRPLVPRRPKPDRAAASR